MGLGGRGKGKLKLGEGYGMGWEGLGMAGQGGIVKLSFNLKKNWAEPGNSS